MVPLTASSPMEPPGKRNGLTTKLSVVKAIGCAVEFQMCGITEWFKRTRKEKWRKQALHESAAGLATGPVCHFNLGIAEAHHRWRALA